jgi:murein DD-endopeptidase MepM/ murein hydrolase activator NlpD
VRSGLGVVVALALAAGGAAAAADKPASGTAEALAVRIVVPGSSGVSTPVVSVPPAVEPAAAASFDYPSDGSVIATGPISASASTTAGRAGSSSSVATVSIFAGEITVDAVRASATAATKHGKATGSFAGTSVGGLLALGRTATRGRLPLADWGYLTLQSPSVDKTAGFRDSVTALDIHLTAAHGGLPAGSEIQLGYAEAGVGNPGAPPVARSKPAQKAQAVSAGPLPGDRPQLLPRVTGPLVGVPQFVTPELTAGPYVFPVYGPTSFADVYAAYSSDASFNHGDDLGGALGQPVVAVADGTVFSIGWNRVGGNKLWLRDHQGNLFYYSRLAAFSTVARNGARVHPGQVIGFMGNTGDDASTGTHLHFELHPVSLLYVGYDGAVDPTTYLQSWKRLDSLPFPVATGWAPSPPGAVKAPQPGAMLIGSSDIATGGLRIAKR